MKNTTFIRFLNCLESIDRITMGEELDNKEKQLLNYISLRVAQGNQLLVGDLIVLKEYGSQSTLHGRIKNLATKGYIKLTEDQIDGRKKFVTPTSKTNQYYQMLSKHMERMLATT